MDNTPKNAFNQEYNVATLTRTSTAPAFVAPNQGNNVGIFDPVGNSNPQTTLGPISPDGSASQGQHGYNVGIGWWLGTDKGIPKLSIGNPNGNNLTWDGDTLSVFGTFNIGGTVITINNTADIQTHLNTISAAGGGTLYLEPGTYSIPATINVSSSIAIIGSSADSTILDMQGLNRSISFAGTNVYTTGTITSISSSVFVTGSGTSWLANITAGQHLFIGTRWYKIAAVTSDTTLILSEGYGDNVTFPSTYRIASVIVDVILSKLTVKSSSGTGIIFSDARKITLESVETQSSNIGMTITNCSEIVLNEFFAASNTSDGVQVTNMGLTNWTSVNTIANGGHGINANNWKTATISGCASDGNTGDGYHLASCTSLTFLIDASGNGGQGVELVSNNSDIDIHGSDITGNTSDGIKLTASSSNCNFYGSFISSNGGYGINIADSTSTNNYIVAPGFLNNTSGNINDAGTSTTIITKVSPAKFGGSGADGALTITSGTTTIDLGNSTKFIKDYTSISITGTGSLAFTNPNVNGTTILLRSQDGITLTSSATPMIDCSGLGAQKGTGVSIGASANGNGSDGTVAYGFGPFMNNKGVGGQAGGGGGTAGALPTFSPSTAIIVQASGKYPYSVAGAGGAGGGAQTAGGASATSGDGGRGGGNLVMECGGAWNFTTAGGISVAGKAGGNGTGSGGNYSASGGGGGGGGIFVAFYNTLTANTGTVTISGGSGGSGGFTGATTTATGGGGGGSVLSAGTNGTTATGAGATGGNGGVGFSLVAQNTEYA